jgi:hypothetical protein
MPCISYRTLSWISLHPSEMLVWNLFEASSSIWYLIIWACQQQIWWGINQPSLSKWLLTLNTEMHVCITYDRFYYALHHCLLFWMVSFKFVACLFHRCFFEHFIISCAEDNSVLIHCILMQPQFSIWFCNLLYICYNVLQNIFEKY